MQSGAGYEVIISVNGWLAYDEGENILWKHALT